MNPKASGEWTIHHPLLANLSHNQAGAISDAHNSALAVERDEWIVANRDLAIKVLELQNQLATAQAAIKDHDLCVEEGWWNCPMIKTDTGALDAVSASAITQLDQAYAKGEGGEMSDQTKPTTGEWTVEGKAIWNDCNPVGIATSSQEAHQIADAHNAALANEGERYASLEKSILDLSHPNCKDLLRQLAAERESTLHSRGGENNLGGERSTEQAYISRFRRDDPPETLP